MHRLKFLLNRDTVEPHIHLSFGHVIHTMAQNYWDKQPYNVAFHEALKATEEVDIRKLDSRKRTRWQDMCESIAAMTTVYYGYHGDTCEKFPAVLNEKKVEYPWGRHAGVDVILYGTLDRVTSNLDLFDSKTAAAVGYSWKAELKKRLLREPQMGMYVHLAKRTQGLDIAKCFYEILVKPYRGSETKIEIIDVTKEVFAFQPIWEQQLDWIIREMCSFYANCRDAEPWPMSNSMCVNKWGECDFLPVCSGKEDIEDVTLYKIKEAREFIE